MRTTLRLVVFAAIAMGCVSMGGPALAGGGSVLVEDQEYYEPGDVVIATAEVWWRDPLGTPGGGPYGVWIARTGESAPNEGYASVIERSRYVADLQIAAEEKPPGGGVANVRLSFTLPDLQPGEYQLMNCNYPCTTMFGDLIGGSFWVGPPPPSPEPPPALTATPTPTSTMPAPATLPAATGAPRASATASDEEHDVRVASLARDAVEDGSDTDPFVYIAIGLVVGVGAFTAWRLTDRRRRAARRR